MSASFEVTFTIEKGGIAQDLMTMQDRTSDEGLRRFLEDGVDPFLQDRMDHRFLSEGDDAVGQWLPLAPSTEAVRLAAGFGGAHPINRRTDEMYNFLTGQGGDTSASSGGATLVYPGKSVDALNAEKIATAQQGKGYPSTPARPVLGLSHTDENQIIEDLTDYILRGTMSIVGVRRL